MRRRGRGLESDTRHAIERNVRRIPKRKRYHNPVGKRAIILTRNGRFEHTDRIGKPRGHGIAAHLLTDRRQREDV
jgi:hypothetical protein